MLTTRLIACIICRDGMVVQSRNFQHTNVVGNAQTATDFFNMWAIDELVVLDASRDIKQRQKFIDAVDELSRNVFVPLAVGGWITSIEEARQFLRLGADKVIVNTQACLNPCLITDLAKAIGTQSIVASIDVKDGTSWIDRGKTNTHMEPSMLARHYENLGAGEIFLTSIDRDGTGQGYDLPLIGSVSQSVSIPVIASGGVGRWEHLVEGIRAGASAVSAANIFHYVEQSTKKAKEHMLKATIHVRPISFFRNDDARRVKYESYIQR